MLVLGQDGVEDGIGNLVGDLVGMAFANRFRGEKVFAHEMLQWSFDPALPASDHER